MISNIHHGVPGDTRKYTVNRAFVLQATVIVMVAAAGIYVAALVLEQMLIKEALKDEATHFWRNYDAERSIRAPNTANLEGYLAPKDASTGVPTALWNLALGYHDFPGDDNHSTVYVTEHQDARLVLIFDNARVRELSIYFGLMPLAMVLAVLYVGALFGYRAWRRAVSPVVRLAQRVRQLDGVHFDAQALALPQSSFDIAGEVQTLSSAFAGYANRISRLLAREREFTRDASHELRTPLTVVKMAAAVVLGDTDSGSKAHIAAERIQRAGREMEELVDAFLMLARDNQDEICQRQVSVGEIAEAQIAQALELYRDKPVKIGLEVREDTKLDVPDKVLQIVLGNVICNAFKYTEHGSINVLVNDAAVLVEDTGIGIERAHLDAVLTPYYREGTKRVSGDGVGLAIVKRLCDKFGWSVTIDSTPHQGTQVCVRFGNRGSTNRNR